MTALSLWIIIYLLQRHGWWSIGSLRGRYLCLTLVVVVVVVGRLSLGQATHGAHASAAAVVAAAAGSGGRLNCADLGHCTKTADARLEIMKLESLNLGNRSESLCMAHCILSGRLNDTWLWLVK